MPSSVDGYGLKGKKLEELRGRREYRTGAPPQAGHETYPPKPSILQKSTSFYHATRFLSLHPGESLSHTADNRYQPYRRYTVKTEETPSTGSQDIAQAIVMP